MDELMQMITGREPLVTTRQVVAPQPGLEKTLREHYQSKRKLHQIDFPKTYDRDLQRIFSSSPAFAKNLTAAAFISRIRKPVRRSVARRTGIYQYTIDRVIEDMVSRCRELQLKLRAPTRDTQLEFAVLLTVHTMNYLHSGRYRCAL
jgi:hypothetical protein